MSNYLQDRLKSTKEKFNSVIGEASGGVFLFGAGFVGDWSVGYIEGLGITVLGFIDSNPNKWDTYVSGKKIYSPNDPCVLKAKVILISSRHAVPAIEKVLSHLSANVLSVDAFVVHQQGKQKIDEIEAFFSHDQRSLETFRSVLSSMIDGYTDALEQYADCQPYFNRFNFFNRANEIFVDAGAYTGDSLERFIWSVNGVFKEIHAFEPGDKQFTAMKKRVKRLLAEWALTPEKILLVNKGVSNNTRSVHVNMGNSQLTQTKIDSGSDISSDENQQTSCIETISLDKYFNGERFSFLKVDVEGSELALLEGGSSSIKAYRPRIALSVYHYPIDIFNLPLKVVEMNQDYSFSLGHHSSNLIETVLYCRDRNE